MKDASFHTLFWWLNQLQRAFLFFFRSLPKEVHKPLTSAQSCNFPFKFIGIFIQPYFNRVLHKFSQIEVQETRFQLPRTEHSGFHDAASVSETGFLICRVSICQETRFQLPRTEHSGFHDAASVSETGFLKYLSCNKIFEDDTYALGRSQAEMEEGNGNQNSEVSETLKVSGTNPFLSPIRVELAHPCR